MPSKNNQPEESVGKNWLVPGDKNTGKSHICKNLAYALYKQGKRIIVADARKNIKTYGEIYGIKSKQMTVDEFMLNYDRGKLKPDSVSLVTFKQDNFDDFVEYCAENVRNSSIILDDLGGNYSGNPPNSRLGIIMSPKNNCNDIFYQIHTIGKVCPFLLDMTDVYVMKQTSNRIIPAKVPEQVEVQVLLNEIIAENRTRPSGEKWAWRIYDRTTGLISWEDKNGKLHHQNTLEYFDGKI